MMSRVRTIPLILLTIWLAGGLASVVLAEVTTNGRIFTHYSYFTDTGYNEFGLSRVYLEFSGDLSTSTSFQVTTDVSNFGDAYTVYVKYAYIDWAQSANSSVHVGMIPTDGFKPQEKTWGFRYISKSALDRYGILTSADLGIGYDIQFSRNLNLMAKLTNGGGYRSVETDTGKRVHLRMLYGPESLTPTTNNNFGFYASYEPVTDESSELVLNGFTGWRAGALIVGFDASYRMRTAPTFEHSVYSAYGQLRTSDEFTLFLRGDYSSIGETKVLMTGIQYSRLKAVKVAPNVTYERILTTETLRLGINGEFRW